MFKIKLNIFLGEFEAITLLIVTVFKNEKALKDKKLVNEEAIHLIQQYETLGLFFIIYPIEWFIRLFMKGNAYNNISFEREAKRNSSNLEYLKTREWYAVRKYFNN